MESPAECMPEPADETLRVESRRFGTMEVPADRVFSFEAGLLGFPHCRRFVLLDHRPGSPFKWMLSLDDPELAFAVADPIELVRDYEPPLKRASRQLEAEPTDLAIFALVTIPADPTEMTINLMAPVAVNLKTLTAQQIILDEPGLSSAHRVVQGAPSAEPAAHEK